MTVRPYTEEDLPFITQWNVTHAGSPISALPPLGVVVEDEKGRLAALFCYEPAGIGCAFLELPVTRPGLTAKMATEAFAFAIDSLMELAGKMWNPPGSYSIFRVCAPPSVARILAKFGFQRESETELIPMIFVKPETCPPLQS